VGQKKQLKEFGSQTEQTGRHVSDTRLAAEQKKRAESVSSPKISMTANKVPPHFFLGKWFWTRKNKNEWTYEKWQRDGLDVRGGADFRVVGAASSFVGAAVEPSAGRQVADVGSGLVLLAHVNQPQGWSGAAGAGHPLDVFLHLHRFLFC
jgi:hypothetical protein